MTQISGTARSQPGPVINTDTSEPNNLNAGIATSSPHLFASPNSSTGVYKNLGNVAQTVTVSAINMSANLNGVVVDLNNSGSATMVLQPGETARPFFSVDVNIPADPTEVDAPAVSEVFSFELDAVWTL